MSDKPTPQMNGYTNETCECKGHKSPKNSHTYEDVLNTAQFLTSRTNCSPEIGIICGSGFGALGDYLEQAESLLYEDIPNFPISTVPGHAGRLVFGRLGGKGVVCMQGRFHAYEGYTMGEITFPVRVMDRLGVTTLIVTNAGGGLNADFKVGDVMIMKDHINLPGLAGLNPLVGQLDERFGSRFVPLSDAYDLNMRRLLRSVSKELGFDDFIKEGVYSVQVGPCFETVTECKMMLVMGGDVAGMSSVPEVTVARQRGIRVLGLSLITNMSIVEYDQQDVTSHDDILEVGRRRSKDLQRLVSTFIERLN